MITQEDIFKEVKEIIAASGHPYSDEDVYLCMGCTEKFNNSGYRLTHMEVAEFLVNEKNSEMIKEKGIKKTILAMSKMRLGTIRRRGKRLGRNAPCFCGSGLKYKKCCLKK